MLCSIISDSGDKTLFLLPLLGRYDLVSLFAVERAFVSPYLSLNGVCCEDDKCIRVCQTIWGIFSALNSKL